MTEQVWIRVAHLILAGLGFAFAVWVLVQANEKVARFQILRAMGLMVVAAACVGIAILAVLLALL